MEILTSKCSNGHSQKWKCHESAPLACKKCDQEEKDKKKKQMKAFEDQQRRERTQQAHNKRMEELDDELKRIKQDLRDSTLEHERRKALAQKEKDIADAKQQLITSFSDNTMKTRASHVMNDPPKPKPRLGTTIQKLDPRNATRRVVDTTDQAITQPPKQSPSNVEWQRQKDVENASNKAIDDIMGMTGLETVKSQVLKIKAKVDTCIRQNSGFQDERFGVVLLGNPGTGENLVIHSWPSALTQVICHRQNNSCSPLRKVFGLDEGST
jgi:hypothetical protein